MNHTKSFHQVMNQKVSGCMLLPCHVRIPSLSQKVPHLKVITDIILRFIYMMELVGLKHFLTLLWTPNLITLMKKYISQSYAVKLR